MTLLIAHRGNINGPQPERENEPLYLLEAIKAGFDVEVDVWKIDGVWYLGHDGPVHQTDIHFISYPDFWLHCKNYEAFQSLINTSLNFFYHTDEDYVLTSQGFIWAYPGQPGGKHTICVMPEWHNTPIDGYAGVCSDYVEKYVD